jgi:hypothetical protein
MIKNVIANGVNSAWGLWKGTVRGIEAAVSAVTRSLELRIGS